MRITSIQNNYLQNKNKSQSKKPNFQAWRNMVLHPNQTHIIGQKPKHMNNTYFFRLSKIWEPLAQYLLERFKDVKKVNVYNLACSDGSEPLSLAMLIRSKYPQLATKLLPIKAFDYDEVAIERAMSREYLINVGEKDSINRNTDKEFNRYFEAIKRVSSSEQICKLKPELYDDVIFSIGNALEKCYDINSENSFVMARNFWPYLSDEEKIKLAFALSRKMRQNSTLMIGEFDLENRWSDLDIKQLLVQAKFKPTANNMIYEK